MGEVREWSYVCEECGTENRASDVVCPNCSAADCFADVYLGEGYAVAMLKCGACAQSILQVPCRNCGIEIRPKIEENIRDRRGCGPAARSLLILLSLPIVGLGGMIFG